MGQPRLPATASGLMADAFIRIDVNNTITLMMNHAEFGNGVYTSLAMMVAEELDFDWQTLKWEAAPTEARYFSPIFGEYLTAGSVSTAGALKPMLKPVNCYLPRPAASGTLTSRHFRLQPGRSITLMAVPFFMGI